MHVSDTMLGLVTGLAFVACYSLLGVPVAWAADQWNRRTIIAWGFAFWSLMTALTGWVSSIGQLALTRFLMGAGEATALAPSNAMVADLYPSRRQPLAMSVLGLANSIALLALFPVIGLVGQHWGWRSMFVAAGLPGLVLAPVFLATVREPARTGMRAQRSSLGQALRFLGGSHTFLWFLVAAVFMGANVYAVGAWTASFLARVHGMQVAEIAALTGPLRGVCSFAGVLASGLLIDRLVRRDLRWRVWLPAITAGLTGPTQALFLLADDRSLWLTGFALTSLFGLMHQAPIFAATVAIARPRMRAVAISVTVLCASLLGQITGPLIVGYLNDRLAATFGPAAIRYSLLVAAAGPLLSALAFWQASRSVEADIARAEG
jgi:predicted MFS family arabinose efflux permease